MLHIMEQFRDLSEEDTQLQYIGWKLGATIYRTPKCHPEFHGGGIKYSWVCAKSLYCMLKLKYKRGR